MNTQSFGSSPKSRNFSQLECYAIFLFLLSPVIYGITWLESENRLSFHVLLFFTGFITYTFFEYISHRFWMHGKEKRHPGKSLERHMNHHRHPTELKITAELRTKLLLLNILFIVSAILLDNYFTFCTGLYTGFVYYCFMHVLLHKPWAQKIFPRLQVSHIHHHCKYPDCCFSTCVTWWDKLFNTSAPEDVRISPRIIKFYFGKSNH